MKKKPERKIPRTHSDRDAEERAIFYRLGRIMATLDDVQAKLDELQESVAGAVSRLEGKIDELKGQIGNEDPKAQAIIDDMQTTVDQMNAELPPESVSKARKKRERA